MVNVVLFPGNIELNHTVGVSDVVYCNSWVRFPRQLVIIAFNIPEPLRELRTVGGKIPGLTFFYPVQNFVPVWLKIRFYLFLFS